MDWLLFLYSDNNFSNISVVFSGVEHNESYKQFASSDFSDLRDMEDKVIDIMNFHVAVRDNVYLVCDIQSSDVSMFSKHMPKLYERIRTGIIDMNSFYLTSQIIKKSKNRCNFEMDS
jgi:hypothetical protein